MNTPIELPMLDSEAQAAGEAGCCLTPSQLGHRMGEWTELASMGLVEVTGESEKLLLRYRRDPEVEGLLRHLVEEERQCCPGLDFRISTEADDIKLEISGPWRQTPWSVARPSRASVVPAGDIRESVRKRYAALAGATPGPSGGCCGASEAGGCGATFEPEELRSLEPLEGGMTLGCGNVLGSAQLKEGETVLDLGSGAGLEVLLAAKRVGPEGKAIGLDMTDEMLGVARANAATAGVENAEFLKGYIEEIPLPPESVDVVISNCVINLSVSKEKVFAEMFRVLKPGGRIALFDVVADEEPNAAERADLDAWGSCLTGALTRKEYRSGLEGAGFQNVSIGESHEVQPGFSSVLVRGDTPPGREADQAPMDSGRL